MGLTTSSIKEKQMLCDESACTGCGACAAICSENCITLNPDFEGFLRPFIDFSNCTSCKRCSMTCPILHSVNFDLQRLSDPMPDEIDTVTGHDSEIINYPVVYAAWNLDDNIRYKSSSGGVFTALAEHILAEEGVVAGAAFDKSLIVRHILIDKTSELNRLRGSKYVQSEINPSLYREIRYLLEKGRKVFFSGTPCEVAGIRRYLKDSYKNLYCCDLICHGVPSPLLFESYLKYSLLKGDRVVGISFRDKTKGWKNSQVCMHLENGKSKLIRVNADPYMSAFLKDYALRPSCYACKFKNTQRESDLTIADFWNVSKKYPNYDLDDKGTSLVLVHNQKGQAWLNACSSKLFIGHADINTAITGNQSLVQSSPCPSQRSTFYHDVNTMSFTKFIIKYHISISAFEQALSDFKIFVKSRLKKIYQTIKSEYS
jgi:coenzyme F420-reducing hydrogenase beta subunit